jgi:hypothetical protein
MECTKALTLFEKYTSATKDFVEAAIASSNFVGSREECAQVRQRADETYANCQLAFSALMKHRTEHDCLAIFRDEARPLEQPQD